MDHAQIGAFQGRRRWRTGKPEAENQPERLAAALLDLAALDMAQPSRP